MRSSEQPNELRHKNSDNELQKLRVLSMQPLNSLWSAIDKPKKSKNGNRP